MITLNFYKFKINFYTELTKFLLSIRNINKPRI